MAFQFKRDKNDNISLIIAGDIDLEVTPDIKTQLAGQLDGARGLTIDAANVSYLDSSGVSILIIAMQSCKQRGIALNIVKMSDEAARVLQLAKLDKILPIESISGPSQLVGVDVFSPAGAADDEIASEISEDNVSQATSDEDLIAELSAAQAPSPAPQVAPKPAPEPAPEPAPIEKPEAPRQAAPEPTPKTPQPTKEPTEATNQSEGDADAGGSFTPGTF
ncbi:MAG: STAS domain-containing protein [Alphaproteobacteria bacterium]|jgi:anti-sigma B factor antagonist|nr:STAS domain-containing protein [Alphaproteobacteria bacterium]